MRNRGTHLFPMMDRVVFGRPAAATLAAEAERLGAKRVFLIVSHTLNTTTPEIGKIAEALGERYAGVFDGVGAVGDMWGASGEQLIEHGAQRIEVGAVVHMLLPVELLRRHILWRADG